MNFPADLSPETAAWIQAQIAISSARTTAALRMEIDKVDDWANGLFVALKDVLEPLLRELPEMGQQLAPAWSEAAQRFDALQASGASDAKKGETLELLEGRKMLYRIFELTKQWPRAEPVQPARRAVARRKL
jgi:hypothetical protein